MDLHLNSRRACMNEWISSFFHSYSCALHFPTSGLWTVFKMSGDTEHKGPYAQCHSVGLSAPKAKLFSFISWVSTLAR